MSLLALTACRIKPIETADGAARGDSSLVPLHDDAAGDASVPTSGTPKKLLWTSGQRLKARTFATPEGEKYLAGWLDAQLDRHCRFVRAGADGFACVPIQSFSLSEEGVWFADAACTQPALVAAADVGPLVAVRPSSCASHYEFFEVGAKVPEANVYAFAGGKCFKALLPQTGPLFQRGAPVTAETAFVRAVPQMGGVVDGLAPLHLAGDDGSLVPWGFQDIKHNLPCTFRVTSDGTRRCVPETVTASSGDFSDPMCRSPLVALPVADRCRETVPFINVNVNVNRASACSPQVDIYRNGGLTPKSHAIKNGVCTENTNAAFKRLALGTKVPLTDFVAGELIMSGASARLRLRETVTPAGVLGLDLYDTKHETSCTPGTAVDATSRCLLASAKVVQSAFADAACSRPVVSLNNPCEHRFVEVDRRIHRKGAAVSDVFTKDANQACVGKPEDGSQFFELGETILSSDLVPLRHEVEN
ncbi:MAG TPA: hypothetical protein VGG33_24145 [Polyangia bacterium]